MAFSLCNRAAHAHAAVLTTWTEPHRHWLTFMHLYDHFEALKETSAAAAAPATPAVAAQQPASTLSLFHQGPFMMNGQRLNMVQLKALKRCGAWPYSLPHTFFYHSLVCPETTPEVQMKATLAQALAQQSNALRFAPAMRVHVTAKQAQFKKPAIKTRSSRRPSVLPSWLPGGRNKTFLCTDSWMLVMATAAIMLWGCRSCTALMQAPAWRMAQAIRATAACRSESQRCSLRLDTH